MLILKCVHKSREINIGSLEFSSCFDSPKFWQSHSLIHKLIEIPHQNMYNDALLRQWYFLHESSIEKAITNQESLFSKLDENTFQEGISAHSLWIQKMKMEVFNLI